MIFLKKKESPKELESKKHGPSGCGASCIRAFNRLWRRDRGDARST